MRRVVPIILFFAMLFNSAKPSEPANEVASTDIKVGLGGYEIIENIDPGQVIGRTEQSMVLHMMEGLFKWVDNGHGEAVLEFGQAEGYEKIGNTDGTVTYTFTLRDDIRWSDGEEVLADDFVYSFQRLVDTDSYAMQGYIMEDIVLNAKEIMNYEIEKSELGITALDNKTLEIVLVRDNFYFEEMLALPCFVPLRRDIVGQWGDYGVRDPQLYMCNGPMKMTEWIISDYIKMEPNEEYYDKDVVKVNSILWEQSKVLDDFKNDEVDFITDLQEDELSDFMGDERINTTDSVGVYYLSLNTNKAPFDNKLVREAFNLAIDRNYIVESTTKNTYKPADAFIPYGIEDVEQGSSFRETGGGYYSVDERDMQENHERARELLAEAGYPNGEGLPTIEYIYNISSHNEKIAEALQAMWFEVLGVEVEIKPHDWGGFWEMRASGEFDIARNGWISSLRDPIEFLELYHTETSSNTIYFNESLDLAIDTALNMAQDKNEYINLAHQAEDIIMQDQFALPIFFYTNNNVVNSKLDNIFYSPMGYYFLYGATEKE